MHVVERGSAFTPDPAPGNPYAIRLFMYYKAILIGARKSGNP
jgi:hypothetical protein